MPLLEVTGGPIAPSGKTLAADTRLVVTFEEPYVDGIHVYPTNYFAELDLSTGKWKPLDAANGVDFYLPGSASGYPQAPKCILKEVQEFTDGTTRSFIRGPLRIFATATDEWFYATPESDAVYITNPSILAVALTATQQLIEWVESGAYEVTSATFDGDGILSTATVKWPDGSAGTFTATTKNTTWFTVDAYTVSHTVYGLTVTQSAVTRNADGYVTTKPALTVA